MDHTEGFQIREKSGAGIGNFEIQEMGHTNAIDPATGAVRQVQYERKNDIAGHGTMEYHSKEADMLGGVKTVDHTRNIKPAGEPEPPKVELQAEEKVETETAPEEEGILDKAARFIGLKE